MGRWRSTPTRRCRGRCARSSPNLSSTGAPARRCVSSASMGCASAGAMGVALCRTRKQRYGEPICQSLSIAHVDNAVSTAFLTVIRPAELEASLALADDLARDRAQVEQQWQLRLERARYEAERAQRQYDQVEP